ncbi:cell division protein FtsW [Lachnospiraceae bacterium KM106-2]|nr:cell division protein FtsW [Lachnospiraceae bacterium KM106-2]
MFSFKQYNRRNFNLSLVMLVSLLCCISSYAIKLSNGASFAKQLFGLVIGLVVISIVSLIDYHFICRFVGVYYLVIIGMLVAVRFTPLGTDKGTNAYRWLDLPGFDLQPSEFAKLTIIIVLAVVFCQLEDRMDKWSTLAITGIIAMIPTFLIMKQPDLSSSLVMVFIFTMMIFAAGLSYKIVTTVLCISLPSIGFALWYVMQPGVTILENYQKGRILGFLRPDEYKDQVWQQAEAVKAIASGRLYGKLISEGPSKTRAYSTIPVNESDFIWSVIGEEFGFLGCCLIIGLLCLVIYFCIKAAKNARDDLGRLLAIGISALFMFQVFANIGVASMILPNTGLPLPFVSYGLSSLLSSMMAIGIILNIGLQQKK